MTGWRPSPVVFLEAMHEPPTWAVDLGGFVTGIDNVHLDVHLSPGFREQSTQAIRKLISEDVFASVNGSPTQLLGAADLDRLRQSCLSLFETAVERPEASVPADLLVLLQLALLKWLLQAVARESRGLADEYKQAGQDAHVHGTGRSLELHERLVMLLRQRPLINRRVLQLLLRQLRRLEAGPVGKLRGALSSDVWPLPNEAVFNPVLLVPSVDDPEALAADYPIANLAENGATDWLRRANDALVQSLAPYLPEYCRRTPRREVPSPGGDRARERSDQGLLKGFLSTELLLSGFMAGEEYRSGHTCWLDEPENLRRLLRLADNDADPRAALLPASWTSPGWLAFRGELRALLHRHLEHWGLGERIVLTYWLPTVRRQLGHPVPLSLLSDFCSGLMSRRSLAQRLAALDLSLEPTEAARVLERIQGALRRFGPTERGAYLDRFLVDFLVLRRDLKLAYKTHDAMDRIRLLEADDDIRLSRANGMLHEFAGPGEAGPVPRRIRAHAVVKADVRGSTRITEELCARGLNPASHFSLNLFAPVNKLLPEFGAEKLFVEGDAVILAIYEYESDGPATTVARACGLARSILQLVALQNVLNRKHGLPELELGIGIAYSPREPHFLYDDGHRIMISPAVNNADRLSGCSFRLRRSGLLPPERGRRVLVVRRPSSGTGSDVDETLAYNVNGIHLEQAAFFKLQREIRLRQARLAGDQPVDGIYFVGSYQDARGRNRSLAVHCAPVRDWQGGQLGDREPERRHYFEVVADERIAAVLRNRDRGPVDLAANEGGAAARTGS